MPVNSEEALFPVDIQLVNTLKSVVVVLRLPTDTQMERLQVPVDAETHKESTVASRLCPTLTEKLNSLNIHGYYLK